MQSWIGNTCLTWPIHGPFGNNHVLYQNLSGRDMHSPIGYGYWNWGDQAFEQGENREYVDCIMVIRNGYIVAEKYYSGYRKSSPHNVKSVSKSFQNLSSFN